MRKLIEDVFPDGHADIYNRMSLGVCILPLVAVIIPPIARTHASLIRNYLLMRDL